MSSSGGQVGSHDGPSVPVAPLTRGFLFADLRGYTSYLDHRGAASAADLLERFRSIVRAAVASHQGAEIRTEGDSFYVVFPSASMAVACALDIVRGAGDEVIHPADAINVGVGVHAGEAIDTPEGPVGTAVNVAARLCAMAGPGEVVVSDTVRALTRSVGSAGFVSLGRRPIKGLDESMSVYRAVPAGTTVPRPGVRGRRPSLAATVAIVLGAVTLVIAFGLVLQWRLPAGTGPDGSSAAVSASADHSPASPSPEPLPPGDYMTRRFALPFRVSFGPSWSLIGDRTDIVAFGHDIAPHGWIDIVLATATLDPPCPESTPRFLGERPEDVIDWLTTRPWLEHSAPRPFNIGRYLGRSVDITVTAKGWKCAGTAPVGNSYPFRLGDPTGGADWGSAYEIDLGERKRVVAIDVDGRTVTILMGSPFPDVNALWDLTDQVIQSIDFNPATP
jgi:class 3 adenylate cyclase